MHIDTAFAELGRTDHFPREALTWAQENWPALSERALALCAAVTEGRDDSPEAESALFFLLHAGAAAGATELHAPLCTLLLDAELSAQVLSDALTEHLGGMLTATFDGDPAPLLSVIASASADDLARAQALLAFGWLAEAGRIPRDRMVAMLRELHATLPPEQEALALAWTQVVAALQLTELEQDARRLFATHIPRDYATLKEFVEDLSAVRRGITPNPVFASAGTAPLEDAVAALEDWSFEPASEDGEADLAEGWIARDAAEPWINPDRHVGRNDPCPCGSGKKYKKCCLAA